MKVPLLEPTIKICPTVMAMACCFFWLNGSFRALNLSISLFIGSVHSGSFGACTKDVPSFIPLTKKVISFILVIPVALSST